MAVGEHDQAILDRIFNPLLPGGDEVTDILETEVSQDIETQDNEEVKKLEHEGVEAAERGDIDCALELFNNAINMAPDWASAYNNRAQVLRLKGDSKGAKRDLDKAIELSHGVGASACQAFTQRGLIHQYEGDTDAATEDYKKAAHLGSTFAKHQLVQLNPYAAMCNQMLSQVFQKLKDGEQDS